MGFHFALTRRCGSAGVSFLDRPNNRYSPSAHKCNRAIDMTAAERLSPLRGTLRDCACEGFCDAIKSESYTADQYVIDRGTDRAAWTDWPTRAGLRRPSFVFPLKSQSY